MAFQVRNDPGLFRFLSLGTYVPERQEQAVTAGANINVTPDEFRALIGAQRQERRQRDERAAAQRLAELRRAGTEPVSPAQWRARLAARRARATP
jgi:hypothetical protein